MAVAMWSVGSRRRVTGSSQMHGKRGLDHGNTISSSPSKLHEGNLHHQPPPPAQAELHFLQFLHLLSPTNMRYIPSKGGIQKDAKEVWAYVSRQEIAGEKSSNPRSEQTVGSRHH